MLEGPAGWIITLIVLPILLVLALLLPPVNLLDRLQAFTYTRITSAGGAITDPDGTIVNFPAEGVRASFQAAVKSTPREEFIEGQAGKDLYDAARNLPDHLIPKSPFYALDMVGDAPGQAILTIPIPNDSLPYETLGSMPGMGQIGHTFHRPFWGPKIPSNRAWSLCPRASWSCRPHQQFRL